MNGIEGTERERMLMQTMERMRKIHIYDLHPGINPADVRLMEIVDRHEGGVTVSALAQELDMPMPAVSRMMRSLEEHGLITRQTQPQDRRRVSVHITPDGRRVYIECLSRMDRFLDELMQTIDPIRFDDALGFCNEIMDNMELVLARQIGEIQEINLIKETGK